MTLGENERLVRAYTLSEPAAHGGKRVGVYVTTKRLVHVITEEINGQTSERVLQCNVSDVRNIDYGKKSVVDAPMLTLGILFLLVGMNILVSLLSEHYDGILLLVASCALLIGAAFVNEGRKKRWQIWLHVFTCMAPPQSVDKTDAVFCFEETQKTVCDDFSKCIGELPAILMDINEMGAAAVEKWRIAQ